MFFLVQNKELKINKGLSIIYFYTSNFFLHKDIIAYLLKIEEIYSDINIFAVDIEQFYPLISRFSLISIPAVVICKDEGRPVRFLFGTQSIFTLKDELVDIDMKYNKGDLYERQQRKTGNDDRRKDLGKHKGPVNKSIRFIGSD